MSQDWETNVVDWSGVTAQTCMNNIELMLATLRSNFSGSSAPSNLVAGNLWYDTDSGNESLRVRNAASDAWLAVLLGDASQKLWIYRNASCEGWIIDAAVTDCVLALKGGTNAYNANGGTTAGTWTQPNHTHSIAHAHDAATVLDTITEYLGNVNPYYLASGEEIAIEGHVEPAGSPSIENWTGETLETTVDAASGNSGNGATAATWRPAAAIGTLQYPDLG